MITADPTDYISGQTHPGAMTDGEIGRELRQGVGGLRKQRLVDELRERRRIRSLPLEDTGNHALEDLNTDERPPPS